MSADLEKLTVEEFFESTEALRSLKENLETNLNGMGCPEDIRDGLMRVNMIIIRQAFLQVRDEQAKLIRKLERRGDMFRDLAIRTRNKRMVWPSAESLIEHFKPNWGEPSDDDKELVVEMLDWLRSQVNLAPQPEPLNDDEIEDLCRAIAGSLEIKKYMRENSAYTAAKMAAYRAIRACEKRLRGEG